MFEKFGDVGIRIGEDYLDQVSGIKYHYMTSKELYNSSHLKMKNLIVHSSTIHYYHVQFLCYDTIHHDRVFQYIKHRVDGPAELFINSFNYKEMSYYYNNNFIGSNKRHNFTQYDYERYLKTLCLR